MRSKRWLFAAAIALQVLLLLGMGARHTYTLQTGRPIRLETAPVDPWEMFRGQYVALNYKISQLQEGQVTMVGAPYKRGEKVWVTVRPFDQYWEAVHVSRQLPDVGGWVALQGTVQWYGDAMGPGGQPQVSIRYGIEQFYVPEGEGPALEDRQHQVTVEAVVDRFGRAAMKRVFVDGKEINWQ